VGGDRTENAVVVLALPAEFEALVPEGALNYPRGDCGVEWWGAASPTKRLLAVAFAAVN
jgi:hypothetical protein